VQQESRHLSSNSFYHVLSQCLSIFVIVLLSVVVHLFSKLTHFIITVIAIVISIIIIIIIINNKHIPPGTNILPEPDYREDMSSRSYGTLSSES
jgi:hypothetical protein